MTVKKCRYRKGKEENIDTGVNRLCVWPVQPQQQVLLPKQEVVPSLWFKLPFSLRPRGGGGYRGIKLYPLTTSTESYSELAEIFTTDSS